MSGIRALVVVRVIRQFEYPKSMLHPIHFMEDARQKARTDMQNVIDEVVKNDHDVLNADMFKFEVNEEPGYKFKNRQMLPDDPGNVVGINKAAKAMTTIKMESKHGALNPELNPALYQREPELKLDGVVIRPEIWYMLHDIEQEYYEYYDEYTHLLRSLK